MTTTTRALIVVDVQPDFCEGGALAVQSGNRVAAGIAVHMQGNAYALTVASLDWHAAPPNDNCGHFALEGEPDFVNSWPVHCVAGTEGATLHPTLNPDAFDTVVIKGHGTQSYSAFEGVGAPFAKSGVGHSLLALLRSNGITDIDVCGIATDYCVKATVFDALGTGFRVSVLTDLCAGVAVESTADALREMMRRGAWVRSEWAKV